MRFLLLFFFTLLITSLYFFPSTSFSVTSPSLTVLAGRRSLTEHELHEKNKVVDEDNGNVEFPREQEPLSSDDLETVYHIDYNGVTTHPIPTPKHPRP
ncbi:hypothetical protein M5689_023009 [Euphorbia peplus]|nr:hypothetical protein M5689_023009 [Euphorbia peplus]